MSRPLFLRESFGSWGRNDTGLPGQREVPELPGPTIYSGEPKEARSSLGNSPDVLAT